MFLTSLEVQFKVYLLSCFCFQIDGQTFSGQAQSKKLAQQDAAESALRGLYFDKLIDQLVKKEGKAYNCQFDTVCRKICFTAFWFPVLQMKTLQWRRKTVRSERNINNKILKRRGYYLILFSIQADGVLKSHPEDDTPWSSLASLAMFKLAAMWQSSTKPLAPVTTQVCCLTVYALSFKLKKVKHIYNVWLLIKIFRTLHQILVSKGNFLQMLMKLILWCCCIK